MSAQSLPVRNLLAIPSIVAMSYVSHERLRLNSCCLSVIMLYLSRCLITKLWMMCSNILHTTQVRDTGL